MKTKYQQVTKSSKNEKKTEYELSRRERLIFSKTEHARRQQNSKLFILPEFLLEIYLTSSQAPEARRRKRRGKVFISLFGTGTLGRQDRVETEC